MEKDPKKRLGCHPRPESDIAEHLYFSDLDWEEVRQKKIRPPFVPSMTDQKDTSNFDRIFTGRKDLSIKKTVNNGPEMVDFYQDELSGFSFYNLHFE